MAEHCQVEVLESPSLAQRQRFPEVSQLFLASGHRLGTTILSTAILAIMLVGLSIFIIPAQHIGKSTVRVLQREGYLLTTQQSRAEDAAFVRAQVALISQEQTLALALQHPELKELTKQTKPEDAVDWLRNQIKAELSIGAEAMTITASDPSADIALHSARAVTEAYIAIVTEQLQKSRERRIHELEITAKEVDEKLMQQWRQLQSRAGQLGSGNSQSLSINEQLKIQSLRDNTHRLRALQFQRSQIELQLVNERNLKPPLLQSKELHLRAAIAQNPELIALREQIRNYDLKIQEMANIVQSQNAPQLVRLQSDRDRYLKAQKQAEAQAEAIEQKRLNDLVSDPSPPMKIKGLEDQLTLIDQEVSGLRETTTQLESSIAEANGPSGVELEIIRHEIDRQEKLADSLWKTIQELRIEERAEPRVAVLSLPHDANRISRTKQLKAAFAASLMALFIAIVGVGYLEWSSCLIRVPADVEKRVRLPLFGATNFAERLRSPERKSTAVNEVAAQLFLQAHSDSSLPIVFVSSPTNVESRTSLSVELAQTIVESDRTVLLVVLDTIKGKLGISKGSGEVRKSSVHGFDYMVLQSDQWAATKALPQLLQEVRARYESILVLGPAILTSPESLLFAKAIDFTLLVVEIGRTRWDVLTAARYRLESANCRILGALLTPPGRPSESNDLAFSISPSDTSPKSQQDSAQESAILADLDGVRGQITQFDEANSPIRKQPFLALSRQTHTRIHNRIAE